MSAKIRLQRHGSKKRPFYFIVIADSRAPRDGKFIQKLGTYNPLTVPATIQLDRQKALEWLNKGAMPTDTVRRILSFKGVLYLKHLLRGVSLGLFDEATAMEKFTAWTVEHEAKNKKRQEEARRNRRTRRPMPGKKAAPAAEAKPEPAPEAAPEATEEPKAADDDATAKTDVADDANKDA
ncbi:MAG: 30S ribosomal protein S16 [Chitinophagaceae bacterium]|nr:30S ribosomal protein S16 [Chitinophagaceae bacterium]MCB0739635.1 30S ribosomal protein S16 [Chitinophagaceae bacterium]HQV05968.1 30S ribosomal protein S16 [Chitinophagaceae bacterium]